MMFVMCTKLHWKFGTVFNENCALVWSMTRPESLTANCAMTLMFLWPLLLVSWALNCLWFCHSDSDVPVLPKMNAPFHHYPPRLNFSVGNIHIMPVCFFSLLRGTFIKQMSRANIHLYNYEVNFKVLEHLWWLSNWPVEHPNSEDRDVYM